MTEFHNAFEAFLASPEEAAATEAASGSGKKGKPAADKPPGVVVKAPSPEVEIPATPIRLERIEFFRFFATGARKYGKKCTL